MKNYTKTKKCLLKWKEPSHQLREAFDVHTTWPSLNDVIIRSQGHHYSFAHLTLRDGPLEKWWEGWGIFSLHECFFLAHCLCRIFFSDETLCTNFFLRQILLCFEQWNLDSLSMFLCFINYSTLTTDQRI